MRGREGSFQNPVFQHRPVIDNHFFKQEVCRDDQHEHHAQQEDPAVHPGYAAAPQHLHQPLQGKQEGQQDRRDDQHFTEPVEQCV